MWFMAKETIHSTEAEMFPSLFRDIQKIFLLSPTQQAPDSKVTKATDEEKERRKAGTQDPLPSQTPTALGPPGPPRASILCGVFSSWTYHST